MMASLLFLPSAHRVWRRSSRTAKSPMNRSAAFAIPATRLSVERRANTRGADRFSMKSSGLSPVQLFTNLFPLWSLGSSALGVLFPAAFIGVKDIYLTLGLSALMLSMGLTLSFEDLGRASGKWRELCLCFIGCYMFMPATALILTQLFTLSREFQVGLILLGIVSGGQASNLCTYIAGGDTALSVAMTTLTTFSATFMLPTLSKFLIGQIIPIDVIGVAKSAGQVVLFPIFLGVGFNAFFPQTSKRIEPALPVAGILATCFLIIVSIAKTSAALKSYFLFLLAPVVILHLCGGLFGYLLPKSLSMGDKESRTLAIETAFKSPALSFVLATKHFQEFAVRVPSAVSIVALAPLVAMLAVYLRSKPVVEPSSPVPSENG
mmetsp:Transcript_17980/g.71999  ORF Transcript_17980/g.71999 Transcript_17980/m.71999 type:complete len:378 (-) Transcript_17980:562-1695(-)